MLKSYLRGTLVIVGFCTSPRHGGNACAVGTRLLPCKHLVAEFAFWHPAVASVEPSAGRWPGARRERETPARPPTRPADAATMSCAPSPWPPARRSTRWRGGSTKPDDRKKAVARELAGLEDVAKVASLDGARLTKLLRAGAADVKALLGQSVPQCQMLRKVLVGRLPCEGFAEAGQRGYRFKGNGMYERLLAGIASATSGGDSGGIRHLCHKSILRHGEASHA